MPIKERNLDSGLRAKIEMASLGMALSPNGNVAYVDSGNAAAGTTAKGTGDPTNPYSTILAAQDALSANNGDVGIVLPGHAETISNATAMALNKAGITWVGIGRGSDRPTITFDNASGNIPISANNVTLSNFLITTSGTIDVAIGITVTGNDVLLHEVELIEGGTTSQFVVGVHASTMLGGLIQDCKFLGYAGNATVTAIRMSGSDRLEITGCSLVGNFQGSADATGAIQSLTTLNVDIDIHHNRVENRDGTSEAGLVFVSTDTGFAYENFIAVPTGDFGQGVVADNAMRQYNNYVVDVAQERGAPEGTASA